MTGLQAKLASLWLLQGGVIAYPTEAVWGLGCDPWNQDAVMELLAIKNRPVEKGLILIAASTRQFAPLYDRLSKEQKSTLDASWPGPTTWLIPDPENRVPFWIKGNHDKVAIRVSNHPAVVTLCKTFGDMLVSTSANEAGKPEIRSRLKLIKSLGDKLDYVVPGRLGAEARPSTIKDLESGAVLR